MTPEEKAKDILVKILEYTPDYIIADNSEASHLAKLHGLILVDELIKETHLHDITLADHLRSGYWDEVKLELEKL